MKIGNFSSLSQSLLGRRWSARLRDEIDKSKYELTKGRRFDMSRDLGYKVSHLAAIDARIGTANGYMTSNKLVINKMAAAQDALSALYSKVAGKSGPLLSYIESLTVSQSNRSVAAIQTLAMSGLGALSSALNVEFNGEYVFGGENVKQLPIKDLSKALENIKKAFKDFTKGKEPGEISPADMKAFLASDNFNDFFKDAKWKENFSLASDKLDKTRISETGETINNGISANAAAFKQTIKGLVMGAALLDTKFSKDTRLVLLSESRVLMQGMSLDGIKDEQSRLGASQNRVKQANEVMAAQLNILQSANLDLGSVDPDEAATKESELETALNLSYQLTSRLAKLSLMNYI